MKDARITIYENMEDVAPFNFTSNQKPYILEAMQRYADHCLYEKSKVNGDSSENKQELHKQSVICCGVLEKMKLGWMKLEDGTKCMPYIKGHSDENMYRVNNCPSCGKYVIDIK